MKRAAILGSALGLALAAAIPVASASATTTLPNGFSAKVVATSGETITGAIDATGYDLGIYVGPGVHGVRIERATVTGANDEGIFVQDASDVVIENSTVENNAVAPASGLSEVKGIALAGTRNVLVKDNTVESNDHGGIGVYDDGPNSPFAPDAIDTVPVPGVGNVVMGNLVKDNLADCGIVLSAKNPGGGVAHNVITRNTVVGGVGGIIVAGGAFGRVDVTGNVVTRNVVTGGFIPGISLHAFGPGVIAGTMLIGNVLSDNGNGAVSEETTGIEIAAGYGGTIAGTQVLGDSVTGDHYGVFHVGDTGTHIAALTTTGVTTPVGP